MYKNDNIFKITTIVLAVVLVLVIGYVAYDKYQAYRNTQLQQVYTTGYNQGINDLLSQVYKSTENCGTVPFSFQNQTRTVADVECIQRLIQQGISQANASG